MSVQSSVCVYILSVWFHINITEKAKVWNRIEDPGEGKDEEENTRNKKNKDKEGEKK